MTDHTFLLLHFLSDNRPHSFDGIRHATGLAEKEVTEILATLAAEGIESEVRAGDGCKLLSSYSALEADRIHEFLGARSSAFTIEAVGQTGSTNDDLMARARQGASSGLVRVAEAQTAGRGRRQRTWYSAPGSALTFSLLWVFSDGSRALSGLPLAVGVGLVRSLEALAVRSVQLKWPNDLLLGRKKLGGVLIETLNGIDNVASAVIGIGLNLRLPQSIAQRIDQPAADLEAAGVSVDRNELLARILINLQDVLETFSRQGFASLRPEWQQLHAYHDKMVRLESGDHKYVEGRVIGVDEYGALLLETESGTKTCHAGELSLRGAGDASQ
jgi:BirA family transcriptional regulator, biotin operon repressor / biotin---[acetyl-CoA-carboxylase] ligase